MLGLIPEYVPKRPYPRDYFGLGNKSPAARRSAGWWPALARRVVSAVDGRQDLVRLLDIDAELQEPDRTNCGMDGIDVDAAVVDVERFGRTHAPPCLFEIMEESGNEALLIGMRLDFLVIE